MMIRVFLLLLIGASLTLRASEPINVPYGGASASVKQPHVVAELIPETTLVMSGKPFDVILHLKSDPGWHTYWINPGDAGLATDIKWTLPEGFTAGPIKWPTPEKHNMGPLVTYGYEGDVYLITTITPPAKAADGVTKIEIKAKASWLVCKEECIPGKGEFMVNASLVSGDAPLDFESINNAELFKAARARLPVPNTEWTVQAQYQGKGTPFSQILESFPSTGTPIDLSLSKVVLSEDNLSISLLDKSATAVPLKAPIFLPEQPNVLSAVADQNSASWMQKPGTLTVITIPLEQNGEKPDKMSGVLIFKAPQSGTAKSVYISEFPIAAAGPAAESPQPATAPSQGTATATPEADDGHRPPLQGEAQPWLIGVLGFAFIGGLILNLMPCVLPVLSLKVFSLMKHAGDDPRGAWKQGAAFTAGVVLSFWLLAGILLALRAAGGHFGWGFQMQSPGFVLALIFIFFLLGLNLFGVFELGTSLVGLDAKVTGKAHGLTSSFLNGALATLAATPCTAPFMGSALGFAAQQPAFVSMLIFTFLALGMAAPYLLLTIFPAALKIVPKPGAWMESFKQFMGFLLMATVIFLIYVMGALVGQDQIPALLGVLLFSALLAWFYGRWGPQHKWVRFVTFGLVVVYVISMYDSLVIMTLQSAGRSKQTMESQDGYQPWSEEAVQKALADGKSVFVDFTAAWCLSCKVNERVALNIDSVRKAFADKGVVLFKADWTHADPAISKALQQYNRDGVPLYLLYSPKQPDKPQILPEVLTPGIVLDAINQL